MNKHEMKSLLCHLPVDVIATIGQKPSVVDAETGVRCFVIVVFFFAQ